MNEIALSNDLKVDLIQSRVAKLPPVDCPLIHRFTPGLYIREIFMPAGTLIVSKIHKTEHPFVISKGRVAVWSEESGVVHFAAPHCGITTPGTRRILFIQEDCIWTTFHSTNKTTPKEVEDEIIEPHTVSPTIETDILEQLKNSIQKEEPCLS